MAKLDMDAIRQLSVAERLAEHETDPSSAIPWDQAEKRLRARS